ncbi:unnamed protein product, partial [Ascophyllum nodosum]
MAARTPISTVVESLSPTRKGVAGEQRRAATLLRRMELPTLPLPRRTEFPPRQSRSGAALLRKAISRVARKKEKSLRLKIKERSSPRALRARDLTKDKGANKKNKGGGCGKKEDEDQKEGVGEDGSVLALKSTGKRKRKKSTKSTAWSPSLPNLNGAAPTRAANRTRPLISAVDDDTKGGDGGEDTNLNRGGKLKPHKERGSRRTTPSGDAATVNGTTNGDAGKRAQGKRKGEVQNVGDPVTPKLKKVKKDEKKGASEEKTSKVNKKKRKKDEDTGDDDAGDDGASSGIVKVRKRPKIKSSTVGAGEGREEEARFDSGSDEEGRTREGGGGKKRKRVKDDRSQGEAK